MSQVPDRTDIEVHCAVLGRIAEGYPAGSPEREAVFAAAQALHYVRHAETQAKFRDWVATWTEPPTALQVLMAKLAGVDDLPHELLDESMRDVERLMETLRDARA